MMPVYGTHNSTTHTASKSIPAPHGRPALVFPRQVQHTTTHLHEGSTSSTLTSRSLRAGSTPGMLLSI